jgi:hypothetical protein
MVNRNIVYNIVSEHQEPFKLDSSEFMHLEWTQAWETLRREFRTEQVSYVAAMAALTSTKASRTDPSLKAAINKYERQFLHIEATKSDSLGYASNFDELQVQIMRGQQLILQRTLCSNLWELLRKSIALFIPRAILTAIGSGWNRRAAVNVEDYFEFRCDAIAQWKHILAESSSKPGVFAIEDKRGGRRPTPEQLKQTPSTTGFRACRCGLDHFRNQCKYDTAITKGRFPSQMSDAARAKVRASIDSE